MEIYCHGTTAILKDFRELEIYGTGKPSKKKVLSQDKGQKKEVKSFIDSILRGGPPLIPFEEIISTTEVTFRVVESIRTGKSLSL